jgi:two-component system, cell cycle response regulator
MSAKILVVDDDENTRQLLVELCETSGYQVVAASDGESALEVAWREAPDAILLDVMLPKLDGFTVIERLRAEEKTRNTPVLILTAISDMEGKVRGVEAGANDYLTKPLKLFEVQTRLKAAMEASTYRRQLEAAQTEIAELRGADSLISAGTYSQLKPSLEYEMNRARRYGRPLACVAVGLMDADDAAKALGENGEAKLSEATTSRLRRCLRGADRLFRIAQDEYLALLPETDLPGARRAAHRMVGALQEASAEGELKVAACAGVGLYPGAAITTGEDLVRAANQGLNLARYRGPGRVGEV